MSTQESPGAGAEADIFGAEGGGAGGFDLWGFAAAARRYWWVILAGVVLGLAAGLILVRFIPPEYLASAEIKVERRAESSGSLSGLRSPFEGATTPEDLKTIERSFASPALMRRIAGQLHGEDFAGLEFDGHPAIKMDEDQIAGFLSRDCTVFLVPETRLIQISFRNGDPVMAQRLANLIVEEGIQNEQEQRIAATDASIRHLREEVKKFEDNLRASEEKLNTYTRILGNVSIDSDFNLVANQLRALDERATAAKAQRLRLESEYAQIQARLGKPDELMEIESIRRLPGMDTLQAQIADARSKIEKLSLRYREASPFMQQARSELAGLEEALQREILEGPKTIEAQLQMARQEEENLLTERQLQEEKVIQVRDLSVPSRVLQREIDADRQAFEAALKRLTEELSFGRNQPVLLQMVNPAGYGLPISSRPVKILGVAVFAGTILGFAGVFLIMQLDTSLKSEAEASRYLGLRVLASVPEHRTPDSRRSGGDRAPPAKGTDKPEGGVSGPHAGFFNRCPALDNAYSATAEAFRGLRASLRTQQSAESGRTVLLTGSLEGDGISFCAINLAVVFARAGQRTLLVDANLRHSSVEEFVFESCGRPGLAEFLQKSASFAQTIHASPLPLLDITPAGAPTPFPAETLSLERVGAFLEAARPYYDLIITDSAPLAKYSDTLGFARLFSMICMVIGCARTPREAARRAVDLLEQTGANPAGLIFNSSPVQRVALLPGEEDGDDPALARSDPTDFSCPACGRTYASFGQLLAQTSPAGPESTPQAAQGEVQRRCSCGKEFFVRALDSRDRTAAGDQRRREFGELLGHLEKSGMSLEEARQMLLLGLAIWRNEAPGDSRSDPSPAVAERTKIFADLLSKLQDAGLDEATAKQKLSRIVERWRADFIVQ
jgi:succinoglycan biosynthesis transport protein ExoP